MQAFLLITKTTSDSQHNYILSEPHDMLRIIRSIIRCILGTERAELRYSSLLTPCLLDFRSKNSVETNVLPSYYSCIIFVYFQVNILTVKQLTIISFSSCYENNMLKARNLNNITRRILYNLYGHLCRMFVCRVVFLCHWNRTSRHLSLVQVEAINDFRRHAFLDVIAPTVKRTSTEEFESRQTRPAVGSTHPLIQWVPRF